MVFSSLIFLYFFLPLTLLGYGLSAKVFKNFFLLSASLFFYAWGEPVYIPILIFSIFINYLLGLKIGNLHVSPKQARLFLIFAIVINLALLGYFKYINFLIDNLNSFFLFIEFPSIRIQATHLPIGISFFTFQALSYLLDVYRKKTTPQEDPFKLALYISFFPQLIAGPIVRYHDIVRQIDTRTSSFDDVYEGLNRFICGLSKKVLLANPLGAVSDRIFFLDGSSLTPELCWLGIICYSLQIYFDFSGYSDMAIGLGRIFGFHFLENFNYPYISRSIQEFWRRWHISLSTWFRDYLYIPLGGNRGGKLTTCRNLFIVFFLCGFWHGASWNFVVWGLYHGSFLIIERAGFHKLLIRLWKPVQHFYVILVVMIGWVFFRADTIGYALQYLQRMFYIPGNINSTSLFAKNIVDSELLTILFLGIIFSMPMKNFIKTIHRGRAIINSVFSQCVSPALLFVLLLMCTMRLISSAYNPFIYFRF